MSGYVANWIGHVGPCPWCGQTVRHSGYQHPDEHPCDFSLRCGAPTVTPVPAGATYWAVLARRCTAHPSPRRADGRCNHHSDTPASPAFPRPARPQRVVIAPSTFAVLSTAAEAAGLSPSALVETLITNHLAVHTP